MPVAAQVVSGKLVLPGIIESDPARTAAVLTPLTAVFESCEWPSAIAWLRARCSP